MGTKYKGSDSEKTALNLFIAMTRAIESLSSRINDTYCKSKLTETQFGTLECLKHLGSMSQKELSQKLLKSCGNMTLVIDNLVKLEYVERTKHHNDRRISIISLTKSGKEIIDSIFPDHVIKITDGVSSLSFR